MNTSAKNYRPDFEPTIEDWRRIRAETWQAIAQCRYDRDQALMNLAEANMVLADGIRATERARRGCIGGSEQATPEWPRKNKPREEG